MLKLFFRKYGENGFPIIILHGLFGMSDNWHNIAKRLSEQFRVYTVDLRNHGNSPHSPVMNYKVMAEDLNLLLENENIRKAYIIGHSMGGKAAMKFADIYPEKIIKMIIADISPRKYNASHIKYIEALKQINFNAASRKEIEDKLAEKIIDKNELLFILKNLERDENNKFKLKPNINSIENNYEELINAIDFSNKINIPVLFMKGENSDYILSEDQKLIYSFFSNAQLKTIKNAAHWIHAENPVDFLLETLAFFKN